MPMELVTFDSAAFLRDHWQQAPLLIRNAWREWQNPLEPDELAGLACEPDVETRLVLGSAGGWSLEHGPIAEQRFARLGNRDWTLLVQAVDHHVPDVAALIEPFRFIPDWRIDDVMVSYAAEGGGVGPHFDRYDVFLIQGLGRRRWRIGARCDESTPLLAHDDLRLLADFEATDEWILEPGDILYLPPGIAHDGVAVGADCMTYSIGFRAPSRGDLIGLWTDDALARLTDDDRYTDPGLQPQSNPGEISGEALARLQAMVAETLLDKDGFARWFGRHSSARKYPEVDWRPDEPVTGADVRAALAAGVELERNPASRFAFIAGEAGSVLLFVDGQCHECHAETAAFAETLCARQRFTPDPRLSTSEAALSVIAELINQGSVALTG
jgi:50S ribosomal protein L16 3-hydroxylase